jgi:hypothetical protein
MRWPIMAGAIRGRIEMMFFVEMTDTFGGEANYSWANRFMVSAKTMRGAITKVARETGFSGRIYKSMDLGDETRHDVRHVPIAFFTRPWDEADSMYYNVKSI